MDARRLPFLRVTSIGGFEKCPYTWAARTFGRVKETSNIYSRIGTAVHQVIEDFLKGKCGLNNWSLGIPGVSQEEQNALRRYLETMIPYKERILAVENEFRLPMIPGAPRIIGHMDAAFRTVDGSVLVVDHKTNRTYQDREWWAAQFQPMFYAWAARQLWPEYPRVRYEIGYVNLGTTVQWETDPSDDDRLRRHFAKIWAEMEQCSMSRTYPARFNDGCRYCPAQVKDTCSVFQKSIVEFKESLKPLFS